ncbi:MAG: enolase C-terminal domain-like protein [Promethearchaeota archaeon]
MNSKEIMEQDDFDDQSYIIPKIKNIIMYMVNIRLNVPFTISGGTSGKFFLPIIIQIKSEDDQLGFGTIDNFPTSVYDDHGTLVSWVSLQEEYIPLLVEFLKKQEGQNIFDVHDHLNKIRGYNSFIISGIELALWDLIGKINKKQCHKMFYPIFKFFTHSQANALKMDQDMLSHHFSKQENDQRKKRLKNGFNSKISIGLKERYYMYDSIIYKGINEGINAFKFKITPKHRYNKKLLEYIRDSFPDIIIDTDANSSFIPERNHLYSPDLSWIIKTFKNLEKFNPRMHEQPSISGKDHFDILRRLQESINTPMCPDESIKSFFDVIQACNIALTTKKEMYINIKMHRMGGPINCLQALSYIELFNMTHPGNKIIPWGGYMPDMEIASNALLHLFSMPITTTHSDVTDHYYWFMDSLFDKHHHVKDGKVKIIPGNGFGVEPDIDKINRNLFKRKSFKVN